MHLFWCIKEYMPKITGKKLLQKRIYNEAGVRIAVTEIRIEPNDELAVGDKLKVSGTSKGKGFAGVVKRWHFAGGPRTHGQSDRERAPGSIGQTTTPGRVYKGKHMAGRLGGKQVTVKGLKILEIKPEEKLMIISGLVPGRKGGLLKIVKQ